MAIADHLDLAAQVASAETRFDAWKRRAASYRRKVQAYRACFLDDDGNLTDAGKLVLADIGGIAGIGKARLGRSSDEIREAEGQRSIVLHMIASMHLNSETLARMARKMRETSEDE